jgi:hypothetical protein
MVDMNDIVKIAVDAHRGNVEKYSVGQSMELLQKALVEANNGSTTLDYKAIRDGKCNGLFALVEEILTRTVVEGLQEDDMFNSLVDFRNVALGDKNLFQVEDANLFVVSEAAEGTQGIRRQRLGGVSETSIPTSLKVVKIYEELNRVLSGRVDFNYFISKVGESFKQKLLNDIYALWSNVTADQLGGVTYFPAAGTYDENALLELIAHVEAAAGGKTATIVGTKKALRNLMPSITGNEVNSDFYNMGYIGKFFGTPVVATPQRHKIGSTEFVMDDDVLTIIAGDSKPVKVVREGDSIMLMGDPMQNADFTMEYMYGERWGCGIVLAGGNAGVGRYELA